MEWEILGRGDGTITAVHRKHFTGPDKSSRDHCDRDESAICSCPAASDRGREEKRREERGEKDA